MFRHQIARLPFSLYSSQKRTIFSNFRKILARSKIKNREALNESDNEEIVTPQSEKNNNQNNDKNINKNNQDQKPETQKDPKSQQPTDTNKEKNQKDKDTANNNDPKNITKAEGQSNTNFVLKEEQSYSVQPFQFFKKQNEEETRRDPLFPAFSQLDQDLIHSHTNYSLHQQLYSPYRWTPLIQKVQPSVEFHEKMYQFRKVRGWDENHTKELVDTMLFEALKGTDYDYYYDYKCLPTKHCKFHGVADFLIYKKSGDHLPLIPVFIAKKKYNPLINKKMEEYNVCEAVGASAWAFANMLAVNKDIQKTRILQTTGHTWVMYEFSREGEFRKTGVYRPNTPGVYKKIYDDPEMQEVMLGIIRYASFIHSENEIGLQKAYDFIDEVKYLEELNDEEREKLEKRRRFWRFLPRKVTDLFFYK